MNGVTRPKPSVIAAGVIALALLLIVLDGLTRRKFSIEKSEYQSNPRIPPAPEVSDVSSSVSKFEREIARLEKKLDDMDQVVRSHSKKFPTVRYLNIKDRKRVLISGGSGFVGSHLVDRLMMEGHEVTVVDNFSTGRKRNIEPWIGHPNFELINHDVINPIFLEVDEIYHLASPASPPHYMLNPIKTIKCNTIGTINLLGLASRVNAKMLFASTSEVYGDPTEHPQSENYWGNVNTVGPRSCYDEGKRAGESLCYAYHHQEKVDVRIARIFNTFGPRMHINDGRVVSNMIVQALSNRNLTIYGDGTNTRSFQYVSDLVSGLIALMASNETMPVNLGNPSEMTISELSRIIKSITGSESEVVYLKSVQDDPRRRNPDIKKAKSLFNWSPQVPLRDGLVKTVDYFRTELTSQQLITPEMPGS